MAFDKLKKMIDGDIGEVSSNVNDDEYYEVRDGFKDASNSGSRMILLEPRAYSESQQIVDYIKARSAVVVNLKRVTPEQAKRIVDFLSGAVYALRGELQKLGNGIFLCTPNNVNVEGKIGAEEKVKSNKKEEYDWD